MFVGGDVLKVACVQLDIDFGNRQANFSKVEKKIREAAFLEPKL